MRRIFLLIALFAILPLAKAAAFPLHGSVSPACAAGSPSPNGSALVGPPSNACTLIDSAGGIWAFERLTVNGNIWPQTINQQTQWGFTFNGTEAGVWANTLQINNGSGSGTLYVLNSGPQPQANWIWRAWNGSGFLQAKNPTSAAIGSVFCNTTTTTCYSSIHDLLGASANGNALSIPALPSGVPAWDSSTGGPGNFANGTTGVTLTCASGSVVYNSIATASVSSAIHNCEIAWSQGGLGQGPNPGINIAAGYFGTRNFTVVDSYVHDNDSGVLSGGSGNGAMTLTNDTIRHNGYYNSGGDCGAGKDHNVYLTFDNAGSAEPDDGSASITGGTNPVTGKPSGSYDVRCSGDPYKLRVNGGTVTNVYVGDTGAYNDTQQNFAVDVPCGGAYTLSHMTIDHVPTANHESVIAYGEELPGFQWSCPPNSSFTGNTASGSPTISNAVMSGTTFTGNTTNGGSTITNVAVTSGPNPAAPESVYGTGMPADSGISSYDSVNHIITLFNAATATGTGVSFTANIPPVVGAAVTGAGMPTNPSPTISTIGGAGPGPYTLTLSANATATGTGVSLATSRNHKLTVDHDIIIDDGPTSSAHKGWVVFCGTSGGVDQTCSSLTFGGNALTPTVSNSTIVQPNANPGCGAGYLGPGVTDGGGNTCFTTRAAAAAADPTHWVATDAYGNACCAYPYLPVHP